MGDGSKSECSQFQVGHPENYLLVPLPVVKRV
jgi:hypothetical protein